MMYIDCAGCDRKVDDGGLRNDKFYCFDCLENKIIEKMDTDLGGFEILGIDNNFDIKNPKEMNDIELLEIYGHYTRMTFRLKEEQDYLFSLRREMLKRMERGDGNVN